VLSLVAVLLLAAPAPSPEKVPLVAVLPFDNQSKDPELDFFQKGLADMVVVDLVNSGAMEVVERMRLQALIDELKLQRTKYFDQATAMRMGQFVGATHVVTGTLQELQGRLRLSVQLIDQGTSKVLVAKDVVGPKSDIFELEEALVKLLLDGLSVRGKMPTRPAEPTSAATLASYGRAVDLADQGQLTAAAARLATLLRESPGFTLGQEAKAAVARRVRLASGNRSAALEGTRKQLLDRADATLNHDKRIVQLPEYQAARHLTYRLIRGQCLALAIRARLTPQGVPTIPDGREAEVRILLESYRQNLQLLATELTDWRGPFKWLPDPQDKAALDQLGLALPSELLTAGVVPIVRRWEGELLLNGTLTPTPALAFTMRPSLAELDRSFLEPGRHAYALAFDGLSKVPAKWKPETLQLETLDLEATGLLQIGLVEQATQRWQQALEQYPKAEAFPAIEAKVQRALELSTVGLTEGKQRRALAKAVSSCVDAQSVEGPLVPVLERRATEAGAWGLKPIVREVSSGCPKAAAATWKQALAWADKLGDCEWFDHLLSTWRRADRAKADDAAAQFSTCYVER